MQPHSVKSTALSNTILGSVVPITAALIAILQMTAALLGPLSPWKGGGFGMFSTIDLPANRYLHVTAQTRDGRQFVLHLRSSQRGPLSSSFRLRTSTFPTQTSLASIAHAICHANITSTAPTAGVPPRLKGTPLGEVLNSLMAASPHLDILTIRDGTAPALVLQAVTIDSLRLRVHSREWKIILDRVARTAPVTVQRAEL